jgi:hypothetical protein
MVVPQTFGWPYSASARALPLDRGSQRSSGPAVEPTFGGADVVRAGRRLKGKTTPGFVHEPLLEGWFLTPILASKGFSSITEVGQIRLR